VEIIPFKILRGNSIQMGRTVARAIREVSRERKLIEEILSELRNA
jgi:hypothetical protein